MKKNGLFKICEVCRKKFYVSLSRLDLKCCSRNCASINSKGRIPWNKGKKTGIISKGAFKRGHIPSKNWYKKMIGHIPWNKGLKGYNAGSKSPSWKGGRQKMGNGYMHLYMPNHPDADKRGRVFEHRIIMEKKLGRYLTKNEVVHHINEIRNDNRPENLMLFKNNQKHLSYHRQI